MSRGVVTNSRGKKHRLKKKGVVQQLGGGGRGYHKFVPVLGGDDTKIAPFEDLFDEPPGEMS